MKSNENAVEWLQARLSDDLLSADLQWSLFVTACECYRHDSLLRPFPPMFVQSFDDGDSPDVPSDTQGLHKNIKSLVSTTSNSIQL